MRIRRNIIVSALLTVGTVGSIAAGPILALTATSTPAVTSVAGQVSPDYYFYHG